MNKDHDVIKYLIEIKENVAVIKERLQSVEELEPRVDAIEVDSLKMKTTVKTIRWVLGCTLVGAPSVAVAVVKILEYVKS